MLFSSQHVDDSGDRRIIGGDANTSHDVGFWLVGVCFLDLLD